MADLSPFEILQFSQQEDQLRETLGAQLARIAFERGNAGINYQRSLDALGEQYQKAFQGYAPSYARRGMLRSGLYQRALKDWGNARIKDFGDLELSNSQRMGNFDLARQQYEGALASGLGRINTQRSTLRAQRAAQLSEVM
jgi:hypothetical protein